MWTRRQMLTNSATLAALSPLLSFKELLEDEKKRKFHISACDWSIGKDSNVEAFDVAKKIGLEGLMVDVIPFGSGETLAAPGSGKQRYLFDTSMQQAYLDASKRTGVKIASLGIGELNNVPYKSDPRTIEWVHDSIDVAKNLGVTVILLAFFSKDDLRNDETGKKEVIRRLKEVAPKAEREGIILGIESYLNAAEHLEIMDAVGSKNVKTYMDFRNTADAGFDVLKEVKQLGKDNICELHMKENGFLLGQGTLPWQKIRDLLYDMEYYGDGWMQIEGAIPKGADVVESYKHNLSFLRALFDKKIK